MRYFGVFDLIPLWLLFLLAIALVMLSVELGFRLGQRRLRQAQKDGTVGSVVAATLALLAFFLGFTFSLAAMRFDARRNVLLEDANAIGTCYLRTSFLPEPQQHEIRKLLRKYVDSRLAVIKNLRIDQAMTEAAALQQRMWEIAVSAEADPKKEVLFGMFIQSLNDLIDVHSKRVLIALQSRLPDILWWVLIAITVAGSGLMGYHGGLSGSERPRAVVPFALAFSVIIVLIADLDRPHEGLIHISQDAMIRLQQSMVP